MSLENTLTAELNSSENAGGIIPSVAIDLIIAQRAAGIAAFMEGLDKLRKRSDCSLLRLKRTGSRG